jgi:NTE family protein
MTLRIALVLGAGGPVGHAFHAGVLHGLARAFSWDPRHAELVLGTSAGAQVGALLRAGLTASDLSARLTGDAMTAEGVAIARHYTRARRRTAEPAGFAPASASYLWRGLRRPWTLKAGHAVASLLPRGRACMDAQAEGFRALFGDAWPSASLWITAVELSSGDAVAFGRAGAPVTDVGTAVTCSGAVPSVCAPVQVGRHHFIDGGIASATHLDLLDGTRPDLAIESSPLSMFAPMRLLLRREVRRLSRRGVPTVVFEPQGDAARAMGINPMDARRSGAVASAAYQSTLAELSQPGPKRTALTPHF